jgi:hypothetical protein
MPTTTEYLPTGTISAFLAAATAQVVVVGIARPPPPPPRGPCVIPRPPSWDGGGLMHRRLPPGPPPNAVDVVAATRDDHVQDDIPLPPGRHGRGPALRRVELGALLRRHDCAFAEGEIVELSDLFYSSVGGSKVSVNKFLEALDDASGGGGGGSGAIDGGL